MSETMVISGVAPGVSGVGLLVEALLEEIEESHSVDISLVYGADCLGSIRKSFEKRDIWGLTSTVLRRTLVKLKFEKMYRQKTYLKPSKLILIHPQSIGFHRCFSIINSRAGKTWLYLMDASFFCIRSYNYIPGEFRPCLRCLGGEYLNAEKMGCEGFPIKGDLAKKFTSALEEWVRKGKIGFLVQSENYSDLIRRHFHSSVEIRRVGLWTKEWDESDGFSAKFPANHSKEIGFNVVFHGADHLAKGVDWALELAKNSPGITFLFPFSMSSSGTFAPNCYFRKINWESGLKEEVENADLVLVPSVWSASIESSLVKSLVFGKRLAVVENPSSFSALLPAAFVLKLPIDPREASERLTRFMVNGFRFDEERKKKWITRFFSENRNLLGRL
jgi:hypothetical protein